MISFIPLSYQEKLRMLVFIVLSILTIMSAASIIYDPSNHKNNIVAFQPEHIAKLEALGQSWMVMELWLLSNNEREPFDKIALGRQVDVLDMALDAIIHSNDILIVLSERNIDINFDEMKRYLTIIRLNLQEEIDQGQQNSILVAAIEIKTILIPLNYVLALHKSQSHHGGSQYEYFGGSSGTMIMIAFLWMGLFMACGIRRSLRLGETEDHYIGVDQGADNHATQAKHHYKSYVNELANLYPDAIVMSDEDGLIQYANEKLITFIIENWADETTDSQSILKKPWYSIFPDIDQLTHKKTILSHLKANNSWEGELTLMTASGVSISLWASCLAMANGGMCLILRDITKQKTAERETSELRKQFFQAQKMESIGRMAGGIAHDFNNILSAIVGYAEFLEEDLKPDTMEHSFALKIIDASEQAKSLIDRILSFSRANSGEKVPIDLVHIVNVTKDMIGSSSSDKIEVVYSSMVNDAYVMGNPTEISQVIMNICVNARDAMDSQESGKLAISITHQPSISHQDQQHLDLKDNGGMEDHDLPKIRTKMVSVSSTTTQVYAGQVQEGKSYFCLEISDNGTGILPAIIEQVFEPFFTTKEQDKGTGLGLSSSLGIIISHNGLLKLESTIGAGTSFKLFFPVDDHFKSKKTMPDQSTISNELNANTQKKSIILVDDDPQVRETIALMLQRIGYHVTDFESPVKAFDYISKNGEYYDAMISDYMMPEMRGNELSEKVSAQCPDLPIIIVSGFAEEAFEDSLSDRPYIKALLRKPLDKEQLKEVLDRVLGAPLAK